MRGQPDLRRTSVPRGMPAAPAASHGYSTALRDLKPMWSPAAEYDQFVTAGFSEDELENMLWHNAERFAGVKVG